MLVINHDERTSGGYSWTTGVPSSTITAMNSALHAIGSFRRLVLVAAFLCVWIGSAVAEEPTLYVLWDTVSPDGRYGMAWSTTGKATLDELPPPNETANNPVANYVIEVASRKIVVQLPEGHFWRLYGAGQPNHFSLKTVWSENSRSMLAIYDSRWSTDMVFLVDVSVPRAVSIENQMEASFTRTLKSTRGSEYTKYKDNLATRFGFPWFVAPGQFYVSANASVPKQENPDFNFGLYFQFETGGTNVTLLKSEPSSYAESADRSLNRAYRRLRGLLSADGQKSLVEEERAWLVGRDKIKNQEQKEAYVEARTQELQTRVENVVAARETSEVPDIIQKRDQRASGTAE
jgi:hypothetical protein